MEKFSNCEMSPASITLNLNKGSRTSYEVFGFAIEREIEGVIYVELQPSDMRKAPVMRVPLENVGRIICRF